MKVKDKKALAFVDNLSKFTSYSLMRKILPLKSTTKFQASNVYTLYR